MSENVDNPEPDKVLTASVHDIRYFAALLRGVNFGNRATITVHPGGISVTVEEARTLLGTAYIFKGLFNEFVYRPDLQPMPSSEDQGDADDENLNTSFEIQLTTLMECLNIFGTAGGPSTNITTKYRRWRTAGDSDNEDAQDEGTSGRNHSRSAKTSANKRIDQYFGSEKGTGMRLSYAGTGYPLTLLVAEDAKGPTATCEINTFDPEPLLSLDFSSSPTVLKIILKSSWLRDAFSELDPACEKLTIVCNPAPLPGRVPRASTLPRLRLLATGNFGSTEMDYPSDKEVLESCECAEQVSFTYRLSHVTKAQKALQSSTKTSLRINEEGLLSLQLLMPTPRPRENGDSDGFIEFRCLPLDEDQ